MKDVRSRERGGGVVHCPVQTLCGQGKVLQMRTSALFGAKTSDILIFMVCPLGQERLGVELARTFCGEGVKFFAILCRCLLSKY